MLQPLHIITLTIALIVSVGVLLWAYSRTMLAGRINCLALATIHLTLFAAAWPPLSALPVPLLVAVVVAEGLALRRSPGWIDGAAAWLDSRVGARQGPIVMDDVIGFEEVDGQ